MEIKIYLIDNSLELQIFKDYTIETIKDALINHPQILLEEIEKLERALKPVSGGNRIDPPFDYNVYV